jgi:hypothetical protein
MIPAFPAGSAETRSAGGRARRVPGNPPRAGGGQDEALSRARAAGGGDGSAALGGTSPRGWLGGALSRDPPPHGEGRGTAGGAGGAGAPSPDRHGATRGGRRSGAPGGDAPQEGGRRVAAGGRSGRGAVRGSRRARPAVDGTGAGLGVSARREGGPAAVPERAGWLAGGRRDAPGGSPPGAGPRPPRHGRSGAGMTAAAVTRPRSRGSQTPSGTGGFGDDSRFAGATCGTQGGDQRVTEPYIQFLAYAVSIPINSITGVAKKRTAMARRRDPRWLRAYRPRGTRAGVPTWTGGKPLPPGRGGTARSSGIDSPDGPGSRYVSRRRIPGRRRRKRRDAPAAVALPIRACPESPGIPPGVFCRKPP